MQQAADLTVAAPTIAASLDGRYMSALKDERVAASEVRGEGGGAGRGGQPNPEPTCYTLHPVRG